MTIRFDFYESPSKDGEEGQASYHARPTTLATVGTKEVVKEIHGNSSLTEGDIRGALASLSDALAHFLGEGNNVHLEGIGYFQVTLTSPKKVDPRKTRAQSVWFKSVKFRPDKDLKSKLMHVNTQRMEFKKHSVRLTNEQIYERLEVYFETNKFITRKGFEALCGMTRITALRHINKLLAEGKIENTNTKHYPMYVLVK